MVQAGPKCCFTRSFLPQQARRLLPDVQCRQNRQAVSAIAAPAPLSNSEIAQPPVGALGPQERRALAEQYGYRSIGAELPDGVTLSTIVQSLPKDVRCLTAALSIF